MFLIYGFHVFNLWGMSQIMFYFVNPRRQCLNPILSGLLLLLQVKEFVTNLFAFIALETPLVIQGKGALMDYTPILRFSSTCPV